MKNPLNNRFKRQLKNDFAKYLVIFLLIVIMVALTSGFKPPTIRLLILSTIMKSFLNNSQDIL